MRPIALLSRMNYNVNIRLATQADAASLAMLERQFVNDELVRQTGLLQGQVMSQSELTQLIEKQIVMVAEQDSNIIGYVTIAAWKHYHGQRIYVHMLKQAQRNVTGLTERNSCQYGPIWVHPDYRGQGVFQQLVAAAKQRTAQQYQYWIAFIAEDNERSFAAHTHKAQMQVLDYVGFDGRDYYLLGAKL